MVSKWIHPQSGYQGKHIIQMIAYPVMAKHNSNNRKCAWLYVVNRLQRVKVRSFIIVYSWYNFPLDTQINLNPFSFAHNFQQVNINNQKIKQMKTAERNHLEGLTRPQLMVQYPNAGLKAKDRKDVMIDKILANQPKTRYGYSTGRNPEPPQG